MTMIQIAEQMSVPMGKVVMASSRAEVHPEASGEFTQESVSKIIEEIQARM